MARPGSPCKRIPGGLAEQERTSEHAITQACAAARRENKHANVLKIVFWVQINYQAAQGTSCTPEALCKKTS